MCVASKKTPHSRVDFKCNLYLSSLIRSIHFSILFPFQLFLGCGVNRARVLYEQQNTRLAIGRLKGERKWGQRQLPVRMPIISSSSPVCVRTRNDGWRPGPPAVVVARSQDHPSLPVGLLSAAISNSVHHAEGDSGAPPLGKTR